MAAQIYLKDYKPPEFLVPRVAMDIWLDHKQTSISSRLLIQRRSPGSPLTFHIGDQVDLQDVLDHKTGNSLDHSQEDGLLTVFASNDDLEIEFVSKLVPEKNLSLQGLYQAGNLLLTQCEAEGFRDIIPFPDRPDVMSTFTVTLHGEKETFPVMLSNGNLVDQMTDGDKHSITWHDPYPKPCYLFAIAAGNLEKIEDHYTTSSSSEILLQIYAESHDLEKLSFAMEALKAAMRWDEKEYEREYDLERYMIVATPSFNMGAMENKGLNIFNTSCLLAHENISTDTDFERVEAVVAHEYFHNWSGNRVTLRDWFQLSLKEGFTVFREQQFMATRLSAEVQRLKDAQVIKHEQFAEDAGSFSHAVRPSSYSQIDNFYTYTVYEKGAEIIRMMQLIMGKEPFRKGAINFFNEYDGKAATIEDLISSLQPNADFELQQILSWYQQPGTPEIELKQSLVDAALVIEFSQSNQGQPPLPVPLLFNIIDANSGKNLNHCAADHKTHEHGLLHILQQEKEQITIKLDSPAFINLPISFSAPIRVKNDLQSKELLLTLQTESDACILQDCANRLFSDQLLAMQENKNELSTVFKRGFQSLLDRADQLPAFYGTILDLPEPGTTQSTLTMYDPVETAKQTLQVARLISSHFKEKFHELIELAQPFLSKPASDLNGRYWRKLYATVINYLAAGNNLNNPELEYIQRVFKEKKSIHQQVTLLKAHCFWQLDGWQEIMQVFFENYSHEDLLIYKWLASGATVPNPETAFQFVQDAQAENFYDGINPNMVKSLVGSFGSSNPIGFHGNFKNTYPWLIELLISVDSKKSSACSKVISTV